MYDDNPQRMGLVVLRGGEKIRRLPNQMPPCHWCPKIPKGAAPVPESAVELSPRNRDAYLHYRRCKAVSRFPIDAIVERNAAICLGIEDDAASERQRMQQAELISMVISMAMRK